METLTLADYAARHDKSTRTVQRWLDKGALPGAQLLDGRWSIPADVLPLTTSAPAGSVVASRAPTPSILATLAGALDTLPAYLDVPTAARLLGLNDRTVARNAKRWGGEKIGGQWGRSWVIPAAAVREIAGL